MKDKLAEANQFIKENKQKINNLYRNRFHYSAPIGWINDPNGLVYFKGWYHIFYQYYPYSSERGVMYWGHAKSKDLIIWEDLPVALAPDKPYDIDGCFSGSAIVKDDKIFLVYTGHKEINNSQRETQCLAYSDDGINFIKYDFNPIIDDKVLGNNGDIADFRDPKVFEREGTYYCVVASKTVDNRGRILLFESNDLLDWKFKSILLEGNKREGIMWECPDLFEIDGKDVLIVSPIEMKIKEYEYHNLNSTIAFIGNMDWASGKLIVENYHEIDMGLDFYAPQTLIDDQNRRILIAWMQMWGRTMPSSDLGHGWAGTMTMPRSLHIINQRLVQEPVEEIYDYLSNKKEKNVKIINGEFDLENSLSKQTYFCLELSTDKLTRADLQLFRNDDKSEYLSISYLKNENLVIFSREKGGYRISGKEDPSFSERVMMVPNNNNELKIEIFRDTSSIEIICNDTYTSSNTFFLKDNGKQCILKINGETTLKFTQSEINI